MKLREIPDDINLWTEEDYRDAELLAGELFEAIEAYEWKHFPMTIDET